jgi:hypothetical protein
MFKKGESGYPQGRAKGSTNHTTDKIKLHYVNLIEGNLHSIQDWLNRVAENDPRSALDFLIKLSPFVIPKKTESDITIDSPINIIIPENSDDSQK